MKVKVINNDNKSHLVVKILDFSKGIDITSGENITPLSTSIDCYNFDFQSGVLKQGSGFKVLNIPTSKNSDRIQTPISFDDFNSDIISVDIFRNFSPVYNEQRDKLVFYASDGYVWYVLLNNMYPTTTKLSNLYFTTKPKIFKTKIDGDDVIFLSNGIDNVGSWSGDGSPIRYPNCPKVIEFCEYNNKIHYVVNGEQNEIFYTPNYDISEWNTSSPFSDGEGSILINDGQGKINRLISFQGHLYVFRDYSILKITEYNDEVPTVKTVYVSGNKIYSDTIQICGDKMVMLTRDGLIKFDGLSVEKINLKFSTYFSNVENKYAVSTYHCGKYYLACKMDFQDNVALECENYATNKNNALLCYDLETGKYNLTRGVDIIDLKSIQSECLNKVIFVYNLMYNSVFGELTNDGRNFLTYQEKYWCSPLSDLGYSNKIKVVKDLSLISKYDCNFTVFTENESKTFKVVGSKLMNKFQVRLSGKQIGFKIQSSASNAEISDICINIDLVDYGNVL